MLDKEQLSYKGAYVTTCPECGTQIEGEGVIATGVPLPHGDEPFKGELLRNIWIECDECGWDQGS